ncbi:MAG: hypothetical protein AAF696_30695 [Bacteroidota bacterium]
MKCIRISGIRPGELYPIHKSLFSLLLGLIILFPAQTQAQDYVYSLSNGKLTIDVLLNSSSPISSWSANVDVSAYSISADAIPSLDLSSSWLCEGGNCGGNVSYNPASKEISIDISANTAASGSGLFASIIIEVDDIEFRASEKLEEYKSLAGDEIP